MIDPVYRQDGVTLYHGDALDVMPTLAIDGPIALVVDPPYGIAHSSNRDNRDGTASASWKGREIIGDGDSALRDWLIEWSEKREASWAVFGNWKCQRPPQSRGVLIWDKGPACGMGDLRFPWKMSWEEIYVGGSGWRGRRDEGVLRGHMIVSWESKGRVHQHQKPVSLMTSIIGKLPEDCVIVDPCCGSGSTLVACLKAGRRAIGVEIADDCIPTIIRRLEAAATPLFAELEATP